MAIETALDSGSTNDRRISGEHSESTSTRPRSSVEFWCSLPGFRRWIQLRRHYQNTRYTRINGRHHEGTKSRSHSNVSLANLLEQLSSQQSDRRHWNKRKKHYEFAH